MVTDHEAAEALNSLRAQFKTWRAVADHLGVNPGLAYKVANGQTRSAKVREALGLPMAVIINAQPGSIIFGETGLFATNQIVAILVLPPEDLIPHMIPCQACGKMTPRWSASQRFCPAHSWTTAEGRRWQRTRPKS